MGIPFVLDILDLSKHLDSLVSLRYFRLVRVFRVLKLQKQTIAVALFVNTIRLSAGPLMVLMFFVMMCIAVFGAVIFTIEGGSYCPPSIDQPESVWHAFAGETNRRLTSGDTINSTSNIVLRSFQNMTLANGKQWKQVQCNIQFDQMFDTCCGTSHGCRCRLDLMGESPEESVFFSTFLSMWWVLTTITTVGYGDTYPTSASGRVIGAIVMVLGVVGFSMPIGIIGVSFEEEYHRLSANPRIMDEAMGVELDQAKKDSDMVMESLVQIAMKKGFAAKDLANFIIEDMKNNPDKYPDQKAEI